MVKKPEITDYVMKKAYAIDFEKGSGTERGGKHILFRKRNGVFKNESLPSKPKVTASKIKDFINAQMTIYDKTKRDYVVTVYIQDMGEVWFFIWGEAGKRIKEME